MPCRSDEEEMQLPRSPSPVTPTKPLRNDGASHDNPDAGRAINQSDDDAAFGLEKKRHAND
jgi:hypothetical protein